MAKEQIAKVPDFGDLQKSLIMPRVDNPLPMPAGAAVPARTPQSQPAAAQSR
jgi:hypothetical protein